MKASLCLGQIIDMRRYFRPQTSWCITSLFAPNWKWPHYFLSPTGMMVLMILSFLEIGQHQELEGRVDHIDVGVHLVICVHPQTILISCMTMNKRWILFNFSESEMLMVAHRAMCQYIPLLLLIRIISTVNGALFPPHVKGQPFP